MGGLTDVNEGIFFWSGATFEDHGPRSKTIYRERKKKEADLRSSSRHDSGLRDVKL